jgi:hypothetical protein
MFRDRLLQSAGPHGSEFAVSNVLRPARPMCETCNRRRDEEHQYKLEAEIEQKPVEAGGGIRGTLSGASREICRSMRKGRLAEPAQRDNRQNSQNAHDRSLRTAPVH